MGKHKKKLEVAFKSYMYIQIVLGIVWVIINLKYIPEFGDTGEYVMRSQTLTGTEIRTVFYPLVIRICSEIGNVLNIEYQIIIYIIQLTMAFFSIKFFLKVIGECTQNSNTKWNDITYTIFFLTIPQVMGFHLSILTDSLAFSALLLVVAYGIRWMDKHALQWKDIIICTLAVTLNMLLRYERMVLCCGFFLLLLCGGGVFKAKSNIKSIIKLLIAVCIVPIIITFIINSFTVIPTERHEETASILLIAKFGRGELEDNYSNFSPKIQDCVTLEMAQKYDAGEMTSSDFLYELEDKIGVSETNAIVMEISLTILKHNFGEQVLKIVKDCLIYANPHLFGVIELNGVHVGGLDWNYSRFIMNSPLVSKIYYNYSLYFSFFLLLIVSVYFSWNEKNIFKRNLSIWSVLGIMSFLLVGLWGVVNNSKPNDRYVLILYVFWELVLMFELEEI